MKPKLIIHSKILQLRWRAVAITLVVIAVVLGWMKPTSDSSSRNLTAAAETDAHSNCNHSSVRIDLENTELHIGNFTAWSEKRANDETFDKAELSEGIALAKARREAMKELIQADPEAALAAAIPRNKLKQLPKEISEHLEQWVSARAPLEVVQSCFHPEGLQIDHEHEFYRATVINDRAYRVHVYGSRLNDLTIPATSLYGIAIDNQLAVSDSRVRVLEPGEELPAGASLDSADALAVEANGQVTILPSVAALADFESSILQSEANPTVTAADSGDGTSTISNRPEEAWATGSKKLLVMLVDFSDRPGTPLNISNGNTPITEQAVSDLINGTNGVRQFFQDGSFGKTDLLLTPPVNGDSPDVTQVLRMPNTASYYSNTGGSDTLNTHAQAAATAAGYNLANYDRICCFYTNLTNFDGGTQFNGWGGRASVGGTNLSINGYWGFREVAHELGHNWGLKHANLWKVTDGDPASQQGASQAYGDSYDTMGAASGSHLKHFSHWAKSLLWWIPDSAVTLADETGTFRVHRLDGTGANLSQPRGVKIVRDATRDYWIGYRRADPSTSLYSGAYVLWGYNDGREEGDLLDMNTPNSNISDAALNLNQTFNDSAAGISFTPVAQGGSGADEWLDIQVEILPQVYWSSLAYTVDEAVGTASFTVNRGASSQGNVFVNYATAPGTASSSTDFAASSGTLYWADGDMSPKTVSVPIVADGIAEGTETFTVTLSSPQGGVVFDSRITGDAHVATVTIADPGFRDGSFASAYINNSVYQTLVQPDGKILVGGAFSFMQNGSDLLLVGRMTRLNSDGSLDTSFNSGTGANNVVRAIARQADGKILVGGDFTSFNGITRYGIVRLNADGSLDTSFNPGSGAGGNKVYAILPLPDGKILIGGNFYSFGGPSREYLARLHPDGSLDTGFIGPDFAGTSGSKVECLAAQADGKILAGGDFYFSGSPAKNGICRVLADGSLDSTFNGVTDGAQKAVGDFSAGRIVKRIAVQPDGKILMAGTFSAFNNIAHSGVARLTSSGSLDAGFSPQTNNYCHALCLLPDQSILIGGDFTQVDGVTATRIARLSSSGVVDSNFAGGLGCAGTVWDFALQADGNVVLGTNYASFQGSSLSRPVWRMVSGLAGKLGVHEFTASSVAGLEGASVTLSVARVGGSKGNLTVAYSTVPGSGTATEGSDYTSTQGTLTWADGDSSNKTFTVPLLSDGVSESPETFLVNLGEPLIGGALLGERQQMTVTIYNAGSNAAPFFTSNPIAGNDAAEGSPYSATLAGAAIDLNGNTLTFSKLSGPSWLNVAANGALSGTPGASDRGANVFVVNVSDGIAAPVEATLNITVNQTTTIVPNVVGLVQATAQSNIAAVGLSVGTVTTAYSNSVPAGVVISQSLTVGASATLGSAVNLVVSLGAQTFTLTVSNGSGSGSYIEGQQVAVTATIPSGYFFVNWTGDTAHLANANSASSTVTMPAGPVSITANLALNSPPVVNAGTNQTVILLGTPTWSPLAITPVAWYDASDATTISKSGSLVSQWRDKSENTNHANQATEVNQPEIGVYTLNGLPLITARSGDKFLSIAGGPSMRMGVAVVNTRSTASGTILNIGSTSSSTHEFFVRNSNAQVSFDGSGNTTGKYSRDGAAFSGFGEDHTITSSGAHIWSGVFSSSNTLTNIVNRPGLASDSTGHDVGEILWFSSELSTDNRQKLEGYLAHKWGQADNLPVGHPYESSAPGQATVVANLNGTATDPDGQSLSKTWTRVSGPTSMVFANANALNTTVTFTETGTYVLRLTANDGTDSTSDEITITVNAPTAYDNWSTDDFANPFTQTGATDNPDGDDLTNLQEFAFGMDPTSSVAQTLSFVQGGAIAQNGKPLLMNFAAQGETPDYRAVFVRRKNHATAGLLYSVDFSADLSQWTTSIATPTLLTGAGSAGDMEVVSVPYPTTVPANGGAQQLPPKFFRVGVDAP